MDVVDILGAKLRILTEFHGLFMSEIREKIYLINNAFDRLRYLAFHSEKYKEMRIVWLHEYLDHVERRDPRFETMLMT